MNRMLLADYKTADGWYHNAHIMTGPAAADATDETIVSCLEAFTSGNLHQEAKCVMFIEVLGEQMTLDQLLYIQEHDGIPGLKGYVSRLVIADEELYHEWLKPEGGIQ